MVAEVLKEALSLHPVQLHHAAIPEYSIPVMGDNQGAIKLAKRRFRIKRNHRIDKKHHFILETVQEKNIHIVYVRSGHQFADALTEALELCRSRGTASL